MKKTLTCLIILLGSSFSVFSQLSVENCQEKARANYPLIRQNDLIQQSQHYNISNASRGYLPQITVNGKATYQSDVTSIDLPPIAQSIGFEIPHPAKDQYQIAAEVSQTVWDGGMISSRKKIAEASAEMEMQKNEVNLYGAIQERINQLYFGILLLDEQLKQNELLQNELQINYDRVAAFIQNGIANRSDIDVIKVEQLKANQQRAELENMKKSYLQMLSGMIGETISDVNQFIKPDYRELLMNLSTENNRPELKLFEAQKELYAHQIRSVKSVNMPKINLFVQGGYGRPGLNMLSNEFEPFYIAGIRFAWNLSGFYTQKNNLLNIELNKQTVDVQKETFLYNTNLKIMEYNNTIEKFIVQLKTDDEIIDLRNSIKQATTAKVENGIRSTSDLVRDINAANLAIQNKSLHEIQLLIAIYNLRTLQNN